MLRTEALALEVRRLLALEAREGRLVGVEAAEAPEARRK